MQSMNQMGRKSIAAVAIAMVLGMAASVMAQVGPNPAATGPNAGAQPGGAQLPPSQTGASSVSSPYWSNGTEHNLNVGGIFAAGQDVANARATATAAKWQHINTYTRMGTAFRRLEREFESSAEYREAMRELKAASEALEAARNNALAGLRSEPRYQAAQELGAQVSDKLAEVHASEDPDMQQAMSLAELKMSYLAPIRSVEIQMLSADNNVSSARDRVVKAGDRLVELRATHDSAIRTNAEVAALRDLYMEQRVLRYATAAYYDSAVYNREQIIDYAYAQQRVPRWRNQNFTYGGRYLNPSPYGGYGYSGYGYGYGGYGIGTIGYGGIGAIGVGGANRR